MASYCTRADIEDRIGAEQLALIGDADQDGAEDLNTVARAIADVDAWITSRIARRWPAYVGVATDILRPLAVDLAVGRLARGPMRTDDYSARAEQARKDVLAIGADNGAVPDAAEAAPAAIGAGEVAFVAGRHVFSGGGF